MKEIKVLMIDDNKQLVDMVKEYFSSHANIEIALTAHNGVEAMEIIKEESYDIILLDLTMP